MPKFSEHEQTGKDESCGQVLKFRKYLKKNRIRDAVCNRKRKDPIWALQKQIKYDGKFAQNMILTNDGDKVFNTARS